MLLRVDLEIVEEGLKLFADLKCPSLSVGGKLPFIIDTGSPRTLLSEGNARELSIIPSSLTQKSVPLWGIGGKAIGWDMPEIMLLLNTDEGLDWTTMDDVIMYRIPVKRKKGRVVRPGLASVLGRDFLMKSEFKLMVDMKNDEAYLEK